MDRQHRLLHCSTNAPNYRSRKLRTTTSISSLTLSSFDGEQKNGVKISNRWGDATSVASLPDQTVGYTL